MTALEIQIKLNRQKQVKKHRGSLRNKVTTICQTRRKDFFQLPLMLMSQTANKMSWSKRSQLVLDYRLKHSFQDNLSLTCSCSLSVQTTLHYFLRHLSEIEGAQHYEHSMLLTRVLIPLSFQIICSIKFCGYSWGYKRFWSLYKHFFQTSLFSTMVQICLISVKGILFFHCLIWQELNGTYLWESVFL